MKAISFPFTLGAFGELESTDRLSKIYLDRLYTLISTPVGQRPMNQTYGIDLTKALFENEDNFPLAIRTAIISAASIWLPEISIDAIDVAPFNQDGYANVNISVSLPNQTKKSLTVNTALFGAAGLIESAGA